MSAKNCPAVGIAPQEKSSPALGSVIAANTDKRSPFAPARKLHRIVSSFHFISRRFSEMKCNEMKYISFQASQG